MFPIIKDLLNNSHIKSNFNNPNINNPNIIITSNNLYWYLCVMNNKNIKINTFICYKYTNYLVAKNNVKNIDTTKITTIMPICKYVPNIFHKYILNYKLRKVYNVNDIYIINRGLCNIIPKKDFVLPNIYYNLHKDYKRII